MQSCGKKLVALILLTGMQTCKDLLVALLSDAGLLGWRGFSCKMKISSWGLLVMFFVNLIFKIWKDPHNPTYIPTNEMVLDVFGPHVSIY